jgi:hypothetical protein
MLHTLHTTNKWQPEWNKYSNWCELVVVCQCLRCKSVRKVVKDRIHVFTTAREWHNFLWSRNQNYKKILEPQLQKEAQEYVQPVKRMSVFLYHQRRHYLVEPKRKLIQHLDTLENLLIVFIHLSQDLTSLVVVVPKLTRISLHTHIPIRIICL